MAAASVRAAIEARAAAATEVVMIAGVKGAAVECAGGVPVRAARYAAFAPTNR